MHKSTIIAVAGLALAASGSALAQQTPNQGPSTIELLQQLEEQGYSDFTEVDRDFNEFEVEATNADSQRVDVEVDPKTGKVLREERED